MISIVIIIFWNFLSIYSVYFEMLYYLCFVFDDGFEVMVFLRCLILVFLMVVEVLVLVGILDVFDVFEMLLIDVVKIDDDVILLDEVNLWSLDGRIVVLDVCIDFGFFLCFVCKIVFFVFLIIVNKSGVNFVIRILTMEISLTDEDLFIFKVKMVEIYVLKFKRGI